jgi:hypothetical protein
MHDFHRTAAEHIAGTDDQRIANFLGEAQGIGFGARVDTVSGLQLTMMVSKPFSRSASAACTQQ